MILNYMLTKEQFFSQKRENDNVLWDRLAVVVPVYNTKRRSSYSNLMCRQTLDV